MSVQQEDVTIINMYAFNIGAPKQMKQILTNLNGEIDHRIIADGFNT